MPKVSFIQIGKAGVTDNFIKTLQEHFVNNNTVRISVLKSGRGEGSEGKKDVKKYTEKILKKLGEDYTARMIGFTIIFKKWKRK